MKAETAKKLAFLAQTKGVTVEELLYAGVPGLANNDNRSEGPSQNDKVQAFMEWAKMHPMDKPLLSDEANSRRSIYER